jgi:hypothetical protein
MNRPTSTPKNTDGKQSAQSAPTSPIYPSAADSGFFGNITSPQSLQHAFHSPDSTLTEETLDTTVSINPKHLQPPTMTTVDQLAKQMQDMTANFTALQQKLEQENRALSARLTQESTALQQNIDRLEQEKATATDELNATKQKCQDLEDKLNTSRRDDRPFNKRGPQVTLPKFDGSVYSSFEKWRRQLEIHFAYLEWGTDDPQRAAVIPTLLTDFAFVQYSALDADIVVNYNATMAALNAIFAMDKKPLSFRRNYINRKQKHGESVRDFSADILQRFAECNPPLETQVDVYTNMLNPLIAAEIQDEEYTDIKTLVACAEKAEHRLRLRKDASQSISQVSFNRRDRRDRSRGRSRDRRSQSRHRYTRSGSRPYHNDGNEITQALARAVSRSQSRNRSDNRDKSLNRPYNRQQSRNGSRHRDDRDRSSTRDSYRRNSNGRYPRTERRNSVNNVKDLN